MEGNILQIVGADILGIVTPVSLCMVMVVMLIRTVPPQDGIPIAILSPAISSANSGAEMLQGALMNALIFVALIGGLTFLIVCLYYYRFMRFLKTYMYACILFVLACSWGFIMVRIIQVLEIPVDIVSFSIFLFNFTVLGMLSIFLSSMPIVITQFYKVMLGVSSAYCYSTIDEWNTWVLLIALAVYDLLAVLTPGGPLKLLVELASKRGEEIPGLIYQSRPSVRLQRKYNHDDNVRSSEALSDPVFQNIQRRDAITETEELSRWTEHQIQKFPLKVLMRRSVNFNYSLEEAQGSSSATFNADYSFENSPLIKHHNVSNSVPCHRASDTVEEDSEIYESKGIKLGLGDFVFYSVLVGRAAMYDLMTVYASYFAIISGLGCTLMLLKVFRKPLPALPISIGLGVLFYFITRLLLEPFIAGLSTNLIMF